MRKVINRSIRTKDTNVASSDIFKYVFDRIYVWAKYELYRQMALKLSNDLALYDAKRLGWP